LRVLGRKGALHSITLLFALPVAVASARNALAAEAYLNRGDAVEARYRAYTERLDRLYVALSERIKEIDTALAAKLDEARTQRVAHGYQVLPKLVPDIGVPQGRQRARSVSYSWPHTEHLIEREMEYVRRVEIEIDRLRALASPARDEWEKLAIDYRRLLDRQRTVHAHVQYNRLWQGAIANDRAGYDRLTALHDAVLERQAIRDALDATDDAELAEALQKTPPIDPAWTRFEVMDVLAEREKTLAENIREATGANSPPPFLRVERPDARTRRIHVPVYTDIEDAEFLRTVKTGVENIWRLSEGEDEFGIEVDITMIPASRLYGESAPPKKGEPIDLAGHVALFPRDGAILTTGALATYYFGRAIVLGPHDLELRVLAHEFGHVLGFKDVYFRGYKDLGEDGFEVMEVVADLDDIMGAPGVGPVLRRHFERVIESLSGTNPTGK
jgi:hypothetical protein